MKSEALGNLRTMREVRSSLEVAGGRKAKTTNSLSRTKEMIDALEPLNDRSLGSVLTRERKRFGNQEASVNKSRQRLLKSRKKLATIIEKNRALTQLRHELQQERWRGDDSPVLPKAEQSNPGPKLRQVKLTY